MITIFMVVAMLAVPTPTQRANAPSDSVVLQKLLHIEAEIARANRECDYDDFREIEADEFIFTDAGGAVTNKQQDLATEPQCRKSAALSSVDEPRLRRYGDVAILNARNTVVGKNGAGQTVTRRNRFTDVFVRRSGKWQLVSGQSTRIPETAPR